MELMMSFVLSASFIVGIIFFCMTLESDE